MAVEQFQVNKDDAIVTSFTSCASREKNTRRPVQYTGARLAESSPKA